MVSGEVVAVYVATTFVLAERFCSWLVAAVADKSALALHFTAVSNAFVAFAASVVVVV